MQKNKWLLFLLIALGFVPMLDFSYGSLQAQSLFSQDFSSSNVVMDYQAVPPGPGQFDQIFTTNATQLPLSIENGEFRMNRNQAHASCGFGRYTDMTPVQETMLFEFSINPIEILASNWQPFKFYIGSGFVNSFINPFQNEVYAHITFHFVEGQGVRPYNFTQNYSTPEVITQKTVMRLYLNNSNTPISYTDPNGNEGQLGADRIDVWMGNILAFDEMTPVTPTQTLTDFKFYFNGSRGTVSIDDINVGPIPPFNANPLCQAAFSANVINCNQIQTTNASSGPITNFLWNFGDGATSVLQQPQHIFTQAGNYEVCLQVSGAQCSTSTACQTVSISGLGVENIPVTVQGNLTLCPGESVSFSHQSNLTGLTWSNGATGNSTTLNQSGTIQLTGTNAQGCPVQSEVFTVSLDNVTVNQPVLITPSGTVDLCSNQSLTFEASGGYAQYLWSNGSNSQSITVTSPGSYSVQAFTTNNCVSASNIVQVVVSQVPQAQFTYNQTTGYVVQLSAQALENASYRWFFNQNEIGNDQTINHEFPFDGNYPVTLIVSNDCGSDTLTATVVVIKVGFETLNGNLLDVFPNPALDWLMIRSEAFSLERFMIEISDLSGRILFSVQTELNGTQQLNVTGLRLGTYLIRVTDSKGISQKTLRFTRI